ncbi:hypothetical protein [Actinoplanes sp. NPDC049118]|uniref:hypothetical protein n=1 Tax=Actinoplanes sp. NPDC049118 TaxID=3155769 RepID=UPI0033C87955
MELCPERFVRLRRLGCGLAVSVVAATASVAVALPARGAPKDDGLTLVVPTLAPMLPGQQGWVSAMWRANIDVCDVEVTISGAGPKFSYPASTSNYSSFYTSSALATGAMDYTAFKVAVPASVTSPVKLTLDVVYHQLPPGQIKKEDDLATKKFDCKGPKGDMQVSATLPVAPSTGAAVVQKTDTVTVPRSKPTWVKLTFLGNKPNLDDFRVTLTPPKGLVVGYPGDGTSAGLDGGSTLPVGEDDFVAVRLDATAMEPGSYKVPLKATYTGGGFDGQLAVEVD